MEQENSNNIYLENLKNAWVERRKCRPYYINFSYINICFKFLFLELLKWYMNTFSLKNYITDKYKAKVSLSQS